MAQSRSDRTKAALIKAAFERFADKGYTATSTREIAAAAKTNIASINYHFGSKAGLRMACAETIVERMSKIRPDPLDTNMPEIIRTAQSPFEAMALQQIQLILNIEGIEPMLRFLLREAHAKGEVFDHIYTHFFSPMFEHFAGLFRETIGRPESEFSQEMSKLVVFSIIGQLAYFRIGQPVVLRHMQWSAYSETETAKILAILQTNIQAIINTYRSAP